MRHGPGERLARHVHDRPFVTLVLSGGYVEAGDEGRWSVGPGDVLIHHAFEAHLDRFAPAGADVLILPLPDGATTAPMAARVADADAIVRAAEVDMVAATALLLGTITKSPAAQGDWPDRLAGDLRGLAPFALAGWADAHGLRPETVSRGFRQAYGCSPKAYRAQARARAALIAIRRRRAPLAAIAGELGFADQAHMTRAVTGLTGNSPGAWSA